MIVLMAGLPRSGSTLLANILAQNPRIAVEGTSGLCELMVGVRDHWDSIKAFNAMPHDKSERAKCRVLSAMLHSYHCNPAEVKINRSRMWCGYLEMVDEILADKVRVIAPIRDVREVLASLELLWRRTSRTAKLPGDCGAYTTLPGRLAAWAAYDGIFGSAYGKLRDAFVRGWGSSIHLVNYRDLCNFPHKTMDRIYYFLEKPGFYHNFENIRQVIQEDDVVYRLPGLHDIRCKLERSGTDWRSVLGDAGGAYTELNSFFKIGENDES